MQLTGNQLFDENIMPKGLNPAGVTKMRGKLINCKKCKTPLYKAKIIIIY